MLALEASIPEQAYWGLFSGITATLISIGGFLHSIWKSKWDINKGVTEQKGAERRDTVTDRDSLIDQLQEQVESEREERKAQARQYEEKLARLEERMVMVERERSDDREYIDVLRSHIWQQLPPPPPLRIGAAYQSQNQPPPPPHV